MARGWGRGRRTDPQFPTVTLSVFRLLWKGGTLPKTFNRSNKLGVRLDVSSISLTLFVEGCMLDPDTL